jgi:hypothetical protein
MSADKPNAVDELLAFLDETMAPCGASARLVELTHADIQRWRKDLDDLSTRAYVACAAAGLTIPDVPTDERLGCTPYPPMNIPMRSCHTFRARKGAAKRRPKPKWSGKNPGAMEEPGENPAGLNVLAGLAAWRLMARGWSARLDALTAPPPLGASAAAVSPGQTRAPTPQPAGYASAPRPDGDIEGPRIWLDGKPYRLPPGLRTLLAYILTHPGAAEEAVIRHCGFRDPAHLHKRLKDLRNALATALKKAPRKLQIRTEDRCIYWQWRP